MSRIQRTIPTRNQSKIPADAATKTTTTKATTRTGNGVQKAGTKSTTTTTNKTNDEKDKTKAPQARQTNTVTRTSVKSNTQTAAIKSQTTKIAKTATTTTKTAANTTTAIANKTQPVRRKPVVAVTSSKTQPLRAKHTPAIAEAIRKQTGSVNKTKQTTSKPNAVLDSFHSVTVASPPPVRRKAPKTDEYQQTESERVEPSEQPVRVRTRTLDEEEVVVLRTDSAKKRIEAQIRADEEAKVAEVKESVAFEVNFDEPAKLQKGTNRERAKSRSRSDLVDEANYSDDFESYESDFETGGSSSPTGTATASEDSSDEVSASASEAEQESVDEASKDMQVSDEEESELTQYPVTVIPRDKERERKLDSGHYEMNTRKQPKLAELSQHTTLQHFDSLDTFSANTSDQLDSGISSYGNTRASAESQHHQEAVVFYGGYANFNTRPVLSKRGAELMSKIQFDTLTYTLFDMKPISYDIYMQTYGKLNTTQTATQTQDNRMSSECQTEDYDMRSMWTQHPPQYDLQTVQKLGAGPAGLTQNCCGEAVDDAYNGTLKSNSQDAYENSLQSLSLFRQHNANRALQQQLQRVHKPIDFERLNAFLLNSAMLISNVLNATTHTKPVPQRANITPAIKLDTISSGYFKLGTRFLNALQVVRVFANARHNLVLTVHESLPEADVYRSDFSNLLMVWSTSESDKPLRLLSTWSEVCRAEICNDFADIVVCGLRDGSIAMWDLRETYSFCSKLDGYLTHFAATQSIVPTWGVGSEKTKELTDLGAVVDVKSFRTPPKSLGLSNAMSDYKSIQFTSLNDTGILTVWTLVETVAKQYDISTLTSHKLRSTPPNHSSRFEYSSPWARVKLIQNAICDLRDYVTRGSLKKSTQFDKTKALFQKNIYSDEALRELNVPTAGTTQEQGAQGLRFTSIDTGCERIYVCTNRNFIIACSKTLKMELFRKIALNESRFLFPTALRVLTNEDFLAVGLSNGSVMIVNCNQYRTLLHGKPDRSAHANSHADNDVQTSNKDVALPDFDLETGKSCAIQNIILNERRSFDSETTYDDNYATRPSTAACIAMITNQQRPFELRVYDQQLLLSGSVLRKHLVQSLELSSDGWRLFALSNGEVRTYDFYLDQEVAVVERTAEGERVVDIAVARTSQREQHLLVLNVLNDVQVHFIKQ